MFHLSINCVVVLPCLSAIKRILNALFEWPENHFHAYQDMASILKNYSYDILSELLESFYSEKKPQILWLIRLIESNSKIKLIDEEGQWI